MLWAMRDLRAQNWGLTRGKLVVASISCFIELHFLYLNLPAQISYSIGILSVIQGYRGDVHHPNFILMYGSCHLVTSFCSSIFERGRSLAGEDGGASHRLVSRFNLDRSSIFPYAITYIHCYDFSFGTV